jgi:hypothetical protein
MVSVATSAAAQIAFAEKVPPNRTVVLTSGALAFVAGVLWFLLSENIGAALRRVDAFAPALKSRESALTNLPHKSRIAAVSLFVLASCFSIAWPWTTQVGHLFYRMYGYLHFVPTPHH